MDFPEMFLINVGVNLRGGDIRMAQHFLDHPQIGTVSEQMSGE